jgi:hypothetical protein
MPIFNFIKNISQILIIILPISLISGPFIPDLSISIIAIFAILYIFVDIKYLKNYFIISALLFCILLIILSFFSSNIFLSFESSIFYFRFIFFAIGARIIFELNKNILKYFFFSLFLAFVVLFFFGLIEFITNFSFENNINVSARVSSLFGDELKLGSYLIRLFPLLLGLYFLMKNDLLINKFLFFSIVPFNFFMITVSGERTAILLSFLFLTLIVIKNYKNKFFVITSLGIISCLTIFVFTNQNYLERIFYATYNSFYEKKDIVSYSNIRVKSDKNLLNIKSKEIENYFYFQNTDNFFSNKWIFSGYYYFEDNDLLSDEEKVLLMGHFGNDPLFMSENRLGLTLYNNKLFLKYKYKGRPIVLYESAQFNESLKINNWNKIEIKYKGNTEYEFTVNDKKISNIFVDTFKFAEDKFSFLTLNGRIDPSSKIDKLYFHQSINLKNRNLYFAIYNDGDKYPKLNNILDSENKKIPRFEIIKYNEFVNLKDDNYKFHIFPSSHRDLFYTAIDIFKDNIIFGSGPKTFRFLCSKQEYYRSFNGCSTHPHNIYLQLLSEIGIIGSSFVIIFFIIAALNFFRNNQNNSNHLFYLAIILNLWPFITTGNFFNNWISIIYFMPILFILKDFDFKQKSINN